MGINDRDGKALKIRSIEGEKARDSVALHGGREPHVVGPQPRDSERCDQLVPADEQFLAIGQKSEAPLEVAEPLNY